MKQFIYIVLVISGLYYQSTYSQCTNNLLTNADFNAGLTGWQTFNGFVPPPVNQVQGCLNNFVVLRANNLPPQDGDGMYQTVQIDSGKCYNLCMCMGIPLGATSMNDVQFWAADNNPGVTYNSLINNTYPPGSAMLIGIEQVNFPATPQQYCINGWYAPQNFTRLIIFNSTLSPTSEVLIDNICLEESATCALCDSANIQPSFTFTNNGTTAQFTNTSTTSQGSITAYEWNFGDLPNSPNDTSTLQNPTYTFSSMGAFFVCLKVYVQVATADGTTIECVDSVCMDITLMNNPPPCDTTGNGFTYIITNNTVSFTGTTGGSAIGWNWNFGDPASGPNNTSSLQNPSHTFSGPGTYNVCLIISYAGTTGTLCYDTICKSITISNVGFEEIQYETIFRIFPNPVQHILYIQSPENTVIHIYGTDGRLIRSDYLIDTQQAMDVSILKSGIYFVEFRKAGMLPYRKKFVKM
ncbi:MAG: PKD domain-containing protein [Flavobacteriales bacterium]|nr:PKD domain-containing protein [Flavobacteriales bacterium]